MNFGQALEHLKCGQRVARAGWNGKGMWLLMVSYYGVNGGPIGPLPSDIFSVTLQPWIGMKTADNGFVPWLASQTDILANDWTIL